MTRSSDIYQIKGGERQHHVLWLVYTGLYETAYIKKWNIDGSGVAGSNWLLKLVTKL